MRILPYGIGALLAMFADYSQAMASIVPVNTPDFKKPKQYKTGKTYPHSSKRQNDRIIRQISAGKINFSSSKF